MEHLDIAKEMLTKIRELDQFKMSLEDLSQSKAKTASQYDVEISKETIRLMKDGFAVSVIDKLAKGTCASFKFEMEVAENRYKNQFKCIDLTQAQLNAYQSINRHLAEV